MIFAAARIPVGLAALSFIFVPLHASAQAIYRCEQGGKVVYTDAPCAKPLIQQSGSPPPPSAPTVQTVIGGGYTSPYGPWSGQTQFQIMESNGARSAGTHFIAFMNVTIGEDGKVTGSSAESSCRLLGLASPGLTPAMLNLDLTVSNCPVNAFNRRYHGTLAMNAKTRVAQLNMQSVRVGIGQAVTADVKATLAR